MPVLQNQTSVNKTDFFFLLANVSTLTAQEIKANQISTGKLVAGQAFTSTLQSGDVSTTRVEAFTISSQNLEANYTEFSTLFALDGLVSSLVTNNIVLDGNFIDTGGAGLGAQLLLNGVPIATGASSFSSLADWSYFPAVSTIYLGSNDMLQGNRIITRQISSVNTSTNTLYATQITGSNIQATVKFDGGDAGVRNLTASTILTSSITANNINGNSNFSSSNWSLYPAQSTVRTAGNPIYDTSNLALRGSNDVNITAQLGNVNLQGGLLGLASGNVTINGGDVNLNADEGIRVDLFSDINLTASNGNRGRINLTANAGYLSNAYGEINLVANGGNVGGIGYGGLISLTANTPLATPSNLTSAVKIVAASCEMYSGLSAPLGSLAGFTYIYGTGGNSIVAGTPPVLPQVPGTNYIWGEFGTTIANDLYTDRILPSFTIAGQDLTIRGRTLPFTAGVRLSNVRSIYMDSPAIISNVGCNYGSNLSYDNGGFTNLLANFTIIAELTALPLYNSFISGFSNISGCNINTNSINNIAISNYLNTSNFQTASISSASISSINNIAISNYLNTSTFQTASISSLSVSSINNFVSFVSSNTSRGFFVDGDPSAIVLRNTNPVGQKTGFSLVSGDNNAAVEVFNTSNGNPLNFLLFADNFGYNTSNITGGIEFDISGNTQVRGCLTVAEGGYSSQLCGSNLQVSSISGLSFINNTRQQVLGDFLTTSNVTVSAANTPTVIPLDTTTVANRLSLVSGAIEVQDTGLFELSVNIQLDKTGGGTDTCDFWIRVNGNDVANTGSQISIQGTNGECLAVCSFYLSLNSGDKVEIVFASSDNTMTATYFPAWTSPPDPYTRPAIPAVIAQMTLIK